MKTHYIQQIEQGLIPALTKINHNAELTLDSVDAAANLLDIFVEEYPQYSGLKVVAGNLRVDVQRMQEVVELGQWDERDLTNGRESFLDRIQRGYNNKTTTYPV
jgi:hypothetical protein